MVDFYRLAIVLAFQAPAICLIICTYIFFSLRRNGLTRRQFLLTRLLTAGCVLSMLSEVASGLLLNVTALDSRRWLPYFNSAAYACLLLNTVLFSESCFASLQKPPKRELWLIRGLYVLVGLLVLARPIFPRLFTYFEGENAMYGPLDDLQTWGCAMIDAAVALLLLVRCFRRSEYADRERYAKLLAAACLITGSVLLYVLFYIPYVIWIGLMLVLVYLHQSLQGLMIYTDELTGLNNRRRMLLDLKEKSRQSLPWRYLLLDMDDFKRINDLHGHGEGDRALCLVASALEKAVKQREASAYRLGGDEFAVILDAGDAQEMADAIRQTLEDRVNEEKPAYPLTFSIGWAAAHEGAIPDVMDLADGRMYENKRAAKAERAERARPQ